MVENLLNSRMRPVRIKSLCIPRADRHFNVHAKDVRLYLFDALFLFWELFLQLSTRIRNQVLKEDLKGLKTFQKQIIVAKTGKPRLKRRSFFDVHHTNKFCLYGKVARGCSLLLWQCTLCFKSQMNLNKRITNIGGFTVPLSRLILQKGRVKSILVYFPH